jgi:hypothetical protein
VPQFDVLPSDADRPRHQVNVTPPSGATGNFVAMVLGRYSQWHA